MISYSCLDQLRLSIVHVYASIQLFQLLCFACKAQDLVCLCVYELPMVHAVHVLGRSCKNKQCRGCACALERCS